ncbi:MAG: carbohydrate kinase family protein [Deltaproteobacteria bacterium]|nr:carbohydrate kinase family protein [Deltaproteobacteria bacterium]
MDLYISGSLAYDRIMDFPGKFSDHIIPDKIHVLNVCFTLNGLTENFGGTAGNIGYSLGLLDEKPIIIASAGQDFDRYEQWIKENNLSMAGIRKITDEFTAGAYITTDMSDNQITAFNPGAMTHPSLYRFDGADNDNALAIISPGCVDDMVAYSQEFKKRNIPYIFDPGQQINVLTGQQLVEMITGSTILISNDYELAQIQSVTGLSDGDILARTPTVITTLGEKGSVIRTENEETAIPIARADRVVDPTGAGDAYRAGLIKGIAMGKTLPVSAKIGATCASYAVACQGTQVHRFTMEAFWDRYRKSFTHIE